MSVSGIVYILYEVERNENNCCFNIHLMIAMYAANSVYESWTSSISLTQQPAAAACCKPSVTVTVVFISTMHMNQKTK